MYTLTAPVYGTGSWSTMFCVNQISKQLSKKKLLTKIIMVPNPWLSWNKDTQPGFYLKLFSMITKHKNNKYL